MLGRFVHDPLGVESEPGSSEGLGWLEMETTLEAHKALRRVEGTLALGGARLGGYEIHCGVSHGAALRQPASVLDGDRTDGALSSDGQVLGSYVHGLFDHPEALSALLAWSGLHDAAPLDVRAQREAAIERLADMVEAHLDTRWLSRLLKGDPSCAP